MTDIHIHTQTSNDFIVYPVSYSTESITELHELVNCVSLRRQRIAASRPTSSQRLRFNTNIRMNAACVHVWMFHSSL